MTDYMKEAERLAVHLTHAAATGDRDAEASFRAALLAHIQRGAVPEPGQIAKWAAGWRCIDESDGLTGEASMLDRIAHAVHGAMLAAAPAPDHFRDAAEMVPMPDTTDIAGYTPQALRDYGDAREAAGYARGLKEAGRDGYASGYNDGIRTAALRGEVKP